MDALHRATRRTVVGGIAATTASLALPQLARGIGAARIVVIGGGFAGAACARALTRAMRRSDPGLAVTLVEADRSFTACPLSNEVIAGLREIEAQQFGYDRLAAEGINVVLQAAARIDTVARALSMTSGDYITKSYAELFFEWKRRYKQKARNMTFRETGGRAKPGKGESGSKPRTSKRRSPNRSR